MVALHPLLCTYHILSGTVQRFMNTDNQKNLSVRFRSSDSYHIKDHHIALTYAAYAFVADFLCIWYSLKAFVIFAKIFILDTVRTKFRTLYGICLLDV